MNQEKIEDLSPAQIEQAEQEIRAGKKHRIENVLDYVLTTIIAISTILWGFNKINTLVYGCIMVATLVLWFSLKFKTKLSTDNTKSYDTSHNQGAVIIYFFIGLTVFMTITVTLTMLIIKKVLHADNFIVNTIATLINVGFLTAWCKNSLAYGIEGKKLVQLKFNGRLMRSAKNLRPGPWGICKITPFTDWLNVQETIYPEEVKFLPQPITTGEDGQVINVKTSQSPKGSPRVTKWTLAYMISDTYLFESTEDAEKLIPIFVFEELETALNEAKKETVEEMDKAKKDIGTIVSKKLLEPLEKIGLKFISFKLNAVERTAAEEKASSEGRARVIKEEQAEIAEDIKARGLISMGKRLADFVDGDPIKARALELAFNLSGDVIATSLQTGSNTQIPYRDKKKRGSKKPPSNNSDTAVRAAIFDLVGGDNTGGEGE